MSTETAATGIAPSGQRLPAEARLGLVRLQVSDLERSVAFYGETLGFRLVDRSDERASLAAARGEPLIELVQGEGTQPVPRKSRLGLYHFAILLPDRAALGRFVGRLSEARIPMGASDHFVSEALYLQDPDGLGIEVYADRPRSAWRYQDTELMMATEPLNVRDVVSAAGGEKWTGMPEGTVIGHVHLHVGDMVGAEAFYHQAIGFDKVVWSYPGALFMSAGGYHHHLGTNVWAGADAQPASPDEARLLHWELVLPNQAELDEVARSVESAGYPVDRDGAALSIADPWGTRIRVRVA